MFKGACRIDIENRLNRKQWILSYLETKCGLILIIYLSNMYFGESVRFRVPV